MGSTQSHCSRYAAHAASPALRTQNGAARACQEPGFDEQFHHLGLRDGDPVEALDRKPLRAPRPHVRDERSEGRPKPIGIRLAQRNERATSALDEQRRLAVEEHDPRAGDASRARTGATRPRQGGSIGLRRVGRSQNERQGLIGVLAQALDRSRQRELRSSKAFDEIPAPAHAQGLEVSQLPVHRRIATGNSFAANPVAAALVVVTEGRTVYVPTFGSDVAGALGYSSPLSLPFAVEQAVPALAAAADGDAATVPATL